MLYVQKKMKNALYLLSFLFLTPLVGNGGESITVRLKAEGTLQEKVIVGYTEKLTTVGEMHPEITILTEVDEGTHNLDISNLPTKTRLLYFLCDGYAPLFALLRDRDGELISPLKVEISRNRYVTIRHLENRNGPELDSTSEQQLVLTQYTYPSQGGAWKLMQWEDRNEAGEDPWIHYWQVGRNGKWGAIPSNDSFDSMKLAPSEGYIGRDYPLKKGMKFYMKNTLGYSKIEILDISEKMPLDDEIIYFSATIKGISSVDGDDWRSTPKGHEGTKVSIEVGSVRKADQAPAKVGFQAYEIIKGKRIEKKSYGEVVTTTSCGPISFVYVADLASEKFKADYTAKGEDGTTIEKNSNPDDANRIWTLPKEISGILWKIHDEWVLVYK